jgi:hypothetical protein
MDCRIMGTVLEYELVALRFHANHIRTYVHPFGLARI